MSKAPHSPSPAMLTAMGDLWRLREPGPDNILSHLAFLSLCEACNSGRSNINSIGFRFALSSALRSLGIPCSLHKTASHLALPFDEAAQRLAKALRATETRRVHIALLDLADELPELAFGSARICRLEPDELRELFDEDLLKRLYPLQPLDADRLSEFHWLVVEETVALEVEADMRALPLLYFDFSQNLGRIEPHKGRFPRAFEDALFFLLLGSWERWSTMPEVYWRGFRVPWIYTVDCDLFVRPQTPPSPDKLSWEPHIYDDGCGGTIETERPVKYILNNCAAAEISALDESQWQIVEQARQSIMFETPIEHFLVRAFLSNGIDEYLAHITTMEAALGLEADFRKGARVTPDRHKKISPTEKMRRRVAGLLGDRQSADEYSRLFDLRSAYLHGRAMTHISTEEQLLARSLARQVVNALVLASRTVASREHFLDELVDKGTPLVK